MMTQITLFSTLAVRKPLEDVILDAFTATTDIEVKTVFDPTIQLERRIDVGETFDVIIGITRSLETLSERGVVDLETSAPVARSGVGLAVPPDSEMPDISTRDLLVATLLNARSVAYSKTGASGIYFAQLIEKLGIADRINERATIMEKGFIADAVVDGRADIAIQQMSELLFVPAAKIAGPFPDELQHYSEFTSAMSTNSSRTRDGQSLIAYLTGDTARRAYELSNLQFIDR